jgi:O-antigen ligase
VIRGQFVKQAGGTPVSLLKEVSRRIPFCSSGRRKDLLYLDWLVAASLVLFPVLALTVKGGANTCLYLLVLASLISIVFRRKSIGQTFFQVLKKYWYVHLSMAGTVLAILINQAFTGGFIVRTYDVPSRLAFFALVAWVLLLLPVRHLKQIQWGIVAGAIIAAIKAHTIIAAQGPLVGNIGFLNRIPYGDMSLLFGVFSLLSIGWNERKEKWAIALKVAGGCAGLYAAYLCQARGGWIAVPVFAAIALALIGGLQVRHKLTVFGLVLVLLGAIYSSSSLVQRRVYEATTDIVQYTSGENLDTSIGIRFQHWRGSWILFKENPFFGVGREHFHPEALADLRSRNIITAAATNFGHSHSEFLFNIATLGIFGLISFLAISLVPGYYFFQAARNPDKFIETAGSMGLALCLGYFVFGLTEHIFDTPISCAFFSLNAAVFFALIVKRQQALAMESQ